MAIEAHDTDAFAGMNDKIEIVDDTQRSVSR